MIRTRHNHKTPDGASGLHHHVRYFPRCRPGAPTRRKPIIGLIFALLTIVLSTTSADDLTFQLARELLSEQSHELAAVEFRRFSMETEEPPQQAAAYLYAGYAYLQADRINVAVEMLDRAEAADQATTYASELTLLNAEAALLANDPDTALYFYELLADDSDMAQSETGAARQQPNRPPVREPLSMQTLNDLLEEDNSATGLEIFTRRRAAALHLSERNPEAARQQLKLSPVDETASLRALEAYQSGSDKSPLIGGLWGLIPGAGYWYSGEIANGFRSLILNSLFIYGMVQTAEDDDWGAFGVIAFFEVTWYSGSIYGGIDAAQRHNRERLENTIDTIEGNMSYRPDSAITVPIFKLNFLF